MPYDAMSRRDGIYTTKASAKRAARRSGMGTEEGWDFVLSQLRSGHWTFDEGPKYDFPEHDRSRAKACMIATGQFGYAGSPAQREDCREQCKHQTITGIMSQRRCRRPATKDGYCTRHHPDYEAPAQKEALRHA